MFVSLAFSLIAMDAAALTNVSGTISSNTTWGAAGSPYVITGAVTVNTGITLTLDPGVVVKGEYSSSKLVVNGTLSADGTPAAPIVFTSFKDDGYGGDTNGDGSASSPAAADWTGIGFAGTSLGNVLDNVVLRYAGYGSSGANFGTPAALYTDTSGLTISAATISDNGSTGIHVSNASPTITGNVIENHSTGIYLTGSNAGITGNTIRNNTSFGLHATSGSSPTVTGNTITGNGNYGVYFDISSASTAFTVSGNSITGNGKNGLYIGNGTLTQDVTWSSDEVFVLYGTITIPAGVTLTLVPGTVVKEYNSYSKLVVNGTLSADGTPASRSSLLHSETTATGGTRTETAAHRVWRRKTGSGSVLATPARATFWTTWCCVMRGIIIPPTVRIRISGPTPPCTWPRPV